MKFRSRLLTLHAIPVEDEALQKGRVYFTVRYCDGADMLAPYMEAHVYLQSINETHGADYYFQDALSYFSGKKPASRHSTISILPLAGVYEYEEALNELLRCSIRRDRRARNG